MSEPRPFPQALSADEAAALGSVVVTEASGNRTSLAELTAGWTAHVQRFEDELSLRGDDPRAWHEHDYLGAMHLRDRLARALEGVPDETRSLANRALVGADDRFRVLTVPDERQLLARVMPDEPIGGGWWWHRVPRRGPVLDGLLRLT